MSRVLHHATHSTNTKLRHHSFPQGKKSGPADPAEGRSRKQAHITRTDETVGLDTTTHRHKLGSESGLNYLRLKAARLSLLRPAYPYSYSSLGIAHSCSC